MNPHFPPPHTGQPTSEKSLHPKSFQSWRWIFLAAILLAAVTISTFYFSSAQAQGDDGAITGLTLTSTTAGTLTVSWDAASPTPTDYRVDWAKSTEGYQSWKVDEGHVYPTPDATTDTITDLSHDTEYKIRMRARYYKGEHMGKSWGGPWATATITVAGEPAETPTPEPVQEEESTTAAGTIDTLTATDDDTGQLLLTWEAPAAPNATPTDYHVNWAKSTEDYPADTAEAGNDHPTTTTHTLAGLEYDTDYNIRVRARYTDGENANSPWNGSWTETTAQVKLPLPMAINMMGTGVSPKSQVILFWQHPSNDSITGYQILRGPKADSLVVIEEDTGSSSTSYTDETPPAGQTHTYAVKARNASGLSPLSNTLTATVPAAKEEEVLIVARHESVDNTLVSNLGQTTTAAANAGPLGGNHTEIATSFTTGTNALGYHLTGVQLNMYRFVGTTISTPQVSIRGDNGGTPGDTALYPLNTSTAITDDLQLITFTTPDEVTLQPNTLYWLYVNATGATVAVQKAHSNDEDAESQTDWLVGDDRVYRTNGGAWTTATANDSLQMKILGHVIPPEPVSDTLVSNLGQTTTAAANAGPLGGNHTEIATSFTTGTNALGYHLTGVQLNMYRFVGTTISTPQVSIRGDNGGTPGDTALYPLNTSTAITDDLQLITFTTPDEVTLQPNTLYWLYVNATGATVAVQKAHSNDEDAESQTDWLVGDDRVYRTNGGAWTTATANDSLQMKILGHVIPPTLVSNLRQTAVAGDAQAGFVSGNHHETAMPFTTGSNAFGYHPTSIQLYLSRLSGSPIVYITIREDNAGLPGETTLARLNMSTAITADANIPQLITFTTSGEVTLQPDTLYWLHVNASPSVAPAGVRQTASDDEDTESQADWRIGDHRVSRIDGGAWTTPTSRNSLQMRILGHIILPTIVDLPADITTTARLAVNESVTGQHEHGRDVDWFAFAAEADTNYQFTANQGQKFATLNVLRIFQDDGTELRNSLIAKKDNAYHAVDRLNNIAFRTDTAGTYYVSIEGWHGGGSNVPYTITMFDDDYSDDITTTGIVDVGESFQNYVMRTGTNPESSRTDDVDWIRVALKADVTYEIVYDVACLHQGRIEGIYGPDGTLLPDTTLDWPRKKKGWCTDLTTEFTPSSDDDYYIAVSAQGSHFPIGSVNPFQGVQGTLTITAK